MKPLDEEMVVQAAIYYTEYKWTMREVAENMRVGETTVRRWFHTKLRKIDAELYESVRRRIIRVISDNQMYRETNGRFKKW